MNAETYLAMVRASLADLPAAERDDLLEDLPGHLIETLAETGGLAQLGSPQAYAAELRSSAGLPPGPIVPDRPRRVSEAASSFAGAVGERASRLAAAVGEQPYGRQMLAFLPELRPGWWVLRGYLLTAVPAAFGLLFDLGVPPFVTLFGSDALGLVATAVAVVASVRLGRRTTGAPLPRRQLVVAGNVALVGLCLVAGAGLRAQIGFNEGVVYAADTSYLQGPDGGISNIYAFDADGRQLTDVQLFDQEGRPLDTLLLQAPDGSYAEPVRALDEYGTEVRNVFPRTLRSEVYREDGTYGVEDVPTPAIAPRRLASPSPSATPTATPSASASPSGPPAAVPAASAPAAVSPSPSAAASGSPRTSPAALAPGPVPSPTG